MIIFWKKKSFWQTHTHVLFWGHWYPCFGFLVTSPLGFKTRVVLPYSLFVHSPRSTSGATPANLLTASIAADQFPTCISRGRSWFGFELAITRMEDERATNVPATQLSKSIIV